MQAIRAKNTTPEMIVRRRLFADGFRYRLHDKRLPGSPDLVLPKYRTCIFVHGCFWHGHDCPAFHWPQTNEEFWREKITRNQARDAEAIARLQELGWRVLVIWECELRKSRREETLLNLEKGIRRADEY